MCYVWPKSKTREKKKPNLMHIYIILKYALIITLYVTRKILNFISSRYRIFGKFQSRKELEQIALRKEELRRKEQELKHSFS